MGGTIHTQSPGHPPRSLFCIVKIKKVLRYYENSQNSLITVRFLFYKLLKKYLIYKLTTDLILNVFQERLRCTVVINDSHASFLQMTNLFIFANEFRDIMRLVTCVLE